MINKWKMMKTGAGPVLVAAAWLLLQPLTGLGGPAAARALQEKALAELKASLAEAPDPALQALVEDLEKRLAAASTEPPPAQPSAPPPPQDREARARAYVDWFLTQMPPVGENGGFEIPRDYRLEPRGEGYHVRLEPVILHLDTLRIPMGPVDVQADPRDDGKVRVHMNINSRIPVEEGGKAVTEITLGGQRLDSVWDPAIESFVHMDWNLTDLGLRDLKDGGRARLDSLTLRGDTEYRSKGPWKQDVRIQAKWLRLDNPKAKNPNAALRLDRAGLVLSARGQDLVGLSEVTRRLKSLSESEDLESPETTKKIVAAFKEMLRRFDGYDLAMDLHGLDLEDPDTGHSRLGRLRFAQSIASGEDKPGRLRMQLGFEDLETGKQGPIPADLTPTGLNLDLSLVNLPPHFGEWLLDLGQEAAAGGDADQEDRLQQQILARIMRSGIGLVLRDTRVQFPDSLLKLNLDARIDPKAVFQSVGGFEFEAVNLDRLIQAARTLGAVDQGADQVLALFSALAARHKEGDRVIDRLQARVDAQGRIWVNGKDVTALFIPAQKQAAPAPAEPKTPQAGQSGDGGKG